MNLREIHETDADAFLRLMEQVAQESPYTLHLPGEKKTSIREQRDEIREILSIPNQTILIVEDRDQLVAWLAAYGGGYERNAHSVTIGIGVMQAYQHRGLGTQLFERMETWAWERKIRRLELLVAATNKPAIGLYRKMGFQIEGTKRDSYRMNGEFINEYLMAKLLIKPEPPRRNPYPKW